MVFANTPEEVPHLLPAVKELAWTLLEPSKADQLIVYAINDTAEFLDPMVLLGTFTLPEKRAVWSTSLEIKTNSFLVDYLKNPTQFFISPEEKKDKFSNSILVELRANYIQVFPLINQNKFLGIILLSWIESKPQFSETDEKLILSIIRSITLVVDNSRLYEITNQKLLESLSLNQISRTVLKKTDIQEILERIGAETLQLTDALGCTIHLVDDLGQLQRVYQNGEVFQDLIPDYFDNADKWHYEEQIVLPLDMETALYILPLTSDAEPLGAIGIYHNRSYVNQNTIRAARSLANQAALAIEFARQYKRLQQAAISEERTRLSRDLHDSISQSLYAMTLYARAMEKHLNTGNVDAAQKQLAEIQESLRNSLGEMRLLIFELRPLMLDQLGLRGSIEHRLKSIEKRSGLDVTFDWHLSSSFSHDQEEHIYRIVQEALNNIIKHARATQIVISAYRYENKSRIVLMDDGQGFDPKNIENCGFGMKTMQERAEKLSGTLSIESDCGNGTIVTVEIPDGKNKNSSY